MAIFKCKMCGGTIEFEQGATVGVCDSCGTKQTLPKTTDDAVANLFNRANNLRRKSEFDKAEAIYEKIVQMDDSEAEAHWGIVLCKYGIEYVEDPKTFTRIPTCHRTSFESITTDPDFQSAIDYSDAAQQTIYSEEARKVDRIQRDILSVVKKEEPFDIFICYKETDENGKRTMDSALANEIYHQLTQEGFKVFYSAITLEDKLGQEYEPYIFAALNSSKVMLAVGTKPEYFEAVWVKNEWSRFLKLMKNDRTKLLIPCYRDMDAYDLPEEFAHLQAQDMSKIGFINDLVRGIKKVAANTQSAPTKETVVVNNAETNTAPLLKRAFMFLEDGDWANADEYCEKVLDMDPENAYAYLGKLMVNLKVRKHKQLALSVVPFEDNPNFQKAVKFSDDKFKNTLINYLTVVYYFKAENIMKQANSEDEFLEASNLFAKIKGYEDSEKLAKECIEKAEETRKNGIYSEAISQMNLDSVSGYEKAIPIFQEITDWKDSAEKIEYCKNRIAEIEEDNRLRAEKQRIENEKAAKKRKKTIIIATSIIAILIAFAILMDNVIIPPSKYNKANRLLNSGDKFGAMCTFYEIANYKDSKEKFISLVQKDTISAGRHHTVGLKSDGTVVAVGSDYNDQCEVSDWTDIVAISAGSSHTVGLKSDGTVVTVGSDDNDKYEVSDWTDIVAISAGKTYTVGLKSDGTVVAVGNDYNGQCEVSNWTDIVAISACETHTVGLKSDGTVVAVGDNYHGQCAVQDWKDIVAISAGVSHTVGLKSDGTVLATSYKITSYYDSYDGQCDVSGWKDIKIYKYNL